MNDIKAVKEIQKKQKAKKRWESGSEEKSQWAWVRWKMKLESSPLHPAAFEQSSLWEGKTNRSIAYLSIQWLINTF